MKVKRLLPLMLTVSLFFSACSPTDTAVTPSPTAAPTEAPTATPKPALWEIFRNFSAPDENAAITALAPEDGGTFSSLSKTIASWLAKPYTLGSGKEYYGSGCTVRSLTFSWQDDKPRDHYVITVLPKDQPEEVRTVSSAEASCKFPVTPFSGSVYYWQVAAYDSADGAPVCSPVFSFTTAPGPRLITNIGGVNNARDAGGAYTADKTRRVRQGLIYRTAYLDSITASGKKTGAEVYGIKTELDLRRPADSKTVGKGSQFGKTVKYINIPGRHYLSGDENYHLKNNWALLGQEIKVFAKKENYPVCFHCSGGRDRTGTVAFLVNGLCGVPAEDLFFDFELTFLTTPDDAPTYIAGIQDLYDFMNTFDGETLKDKIETFCIAAGLTHEEIAAIREILLEEV